MLTDLPEGNADAEGLSGQLGTLSLLCTVSCPTEVGLTDENCHA